MTEIKTHEELISMAFKAYEESSINYGLTDSQMIERMRVQSDAALWGIIQYFKAN